MTLKILWAIGIIFWFILIIKQAMPDELGFAIFCYMSCEFLWLLIIAFIDSSVEGDILRNVFDKEFLIREIIGIIIIISFLVIWHKKLESMYDNYKTIKEEASISISFSKFKNLYAVAPNKWICSNNKFAYNDENHAFYHTYLKFKYPHEYFQYWYFIKSNKKEAEKVNKDILLAQLTESWIKDIEKYKKENNVKF